MIENFDADDLKEKMNNLVLECNLFVLEETFGERLSDVPYYSFYYISYPFIWFVYWAWAGILDAFRDVQSPYR